MAATRARARLPGALGTAGAALWRRLTADAEIVFSVSEMVTLELACRQADDVARLEALLKSDGFVVLGSKGQPKLSSVPGELRLQRAALARLVALLAIPEADEDEGLAPAARKAQRAAQARWRRQAATREAARGGATR